MKTLFSLISRNRKLFFRDTGMLLSSLITPIILIVLYGTFLANIYKDSFTQNIPEFLNISEKLINGTVAGQLAASLLAVSCITVTFCINLTMIQDRANGTRKDFNVAPIKKTTIYLGYFFSTVLNSLMVNFFALALCFAYISMMGWYISVVDLLLIIVDVTLVVLFGTVLSSIICYPLKTQGQMSAVGTIVSAGYGFICGAYMPISNFGSGLKTVLSYLPSTYCTALIKNQMLNGVFEEMNTQGFPEEIVDSIAKSLDCRPELFGSLVSPFTMMMIVLCSVAVLGIIYLFIASKKEKN